MEMRELGRTGMNVSVLGLGLAEIPRHDYAYSDVEATARVLNNALDNGINFLDTAACYGETEEMMGRTVAGRRSEYYLATKAGHVTGGASGEPWTAPSSRRASTAASSGSGRTTSTWCRSTPARWRSWRRAR